MAHWKTITSFDVVLQISTPTTGTGSEEEDGVIAAEADDSLPECATPSSRKRSLDALDSSQLKKSKLTMIPIDEEIESKKIGKPTFMYFPVDPFYI